MKNAFMPAVLFLSLAAPTRVLQYTGEDARRLIFAAVGLRAGLPFNLFVACSHETECIEIPLAPSQTADPVAIRQLIRQGSNQIFRVTNERQLAALRQEFDRLGTMTAHYDGLQASCAETTSTVVCKVTPFDGEFFDQ